MANPERFFLAGVMGWPVMHSRSPKLHNYWFAQHGLPGTYVPLAVSRKACARRYARCRRSPSPAPI
jgi:shikimate dehydrogenase